MTTLLDKSLLIKLSKHTDVLKFLASLTPSELNFFITLTAWSPSLFSLIDKLPNSNLHVLTLHKIWDYIDNKEEFVKYYTNLINAATNQNFDVIDAFSKGQLDSKNWLITELAKLDIGLGNVWILCGWIGTLAYLFNNSNHNMMYNNLRSFDVDDRCAALAEIFNKPAVIDQWRFKATTLDVNTMWYKDYKFPTLKSDGTVRYIQESADTVINTSCDHMNNDTWWSRIPAGTLVVLQNNNFLEKDEHVNTVTSLEEFKNKYSLTTTLYEGELDCSLYTRYMLIGRK